MTEHQNTRSKIDSTKGRNRQICCHEGYWKVLQDPCIPNSSNSHRDTPRLTKISGTFSGGSCLWSYERRGALACDMSRWAFTTEQSWKWSHHGKIWTLRPATCQVRPLHSAMKNLSFPSDDDLLVHHDVNNVEHYGLSFCSPCPYHKITAPVTNRLTRANGKQIFQPKFITWS